MVRRRSHRGRAAGGRDFLSRVHQVTRERVRQTPMTAILFSLLEQSVGREGERKVPRVVGWDALLVLL